MFRRQSGLQRTVAALFSQSRSKSTWKPWDDDFTQEIDSNYPVPPISLAQNTSHILNYVQKKRTMFVLGSPGCGKSSLANDVEETAVKSKKYDEVFVVEDITKAAEIQAKMKQLQKDKKKKKCLFICDEAQEMIAKKIINPKKMFSKGYHVAYFGTTTRTNDDDFSTPKELKPHKHWMYAPSMDRKLVSEFAQRVLTKCGADTKDAKRISNMSFDYSGCSMNVLLRILGYAVENNGKLPIPQHFLQKADAPRVVVNGDRKWEKDSGKMKIAQTLLAVGSYEIDENSSNREKAMLRRGFVAPERNYHDVSSIAKFSKVDDGDPLTWAHALQPLYCNIKKIKPLDTEDIPAAKMTAPINALLRFLPRFPIELLVSNVVNECPSMNASEYNFQAGFYLCMKTQLPPTTYVSNELQTKLKKKRGRLDFYLAPDTKTKWGLELLINGSPKTINDHKTRFTPGGKYSKLKVSNYLIVDCQLKPTTSPAKKNNHYIRISPHKAMGWNVFVIEYKGRKLYVPRDTVPRYCPNITALHPNVKVAVKLVNKDGPFYVKVQLPGGKSVATDVAKELEEKTVDGLKKAVLKDPVTADAVKGKGHLLTVYPPGAKKGDTAYTKMSTPLYNAEEEEPYWVEVK